MLRGRDIKRRRAASFAPEALEDRVELTAGVARATAMLDHLGNDLRARAAEVGANVAHRTAQFDAGYRAALAGAASAPGESGPTVARIHRDYGRLVRNTARRADAMVRHARRVLGQSPAAAAMIRAANPAASNQLDRELSSIGAALKAEARTARAAAGAIAGPAHASIVQARQSPASAMGRVDAAGAGLSRLSRSEVAADRAALQSFASGYDAALGALRTGLAALPQGPMATARTRARARVTHPAGGRAVARPLGFRPGGLLGGTSVGLGAAGVGRFRAGALGVGRLRYGLTGFGSPTQGLAGNFGTAGLAPGAVMGTTVL